MAKKKDIENDSNAIEMENRHLFGEFLVEKGHINQEQLEKALAEKIEKGCLLGRVLSDLEILDEEKVTKALAEFLSMEYLCLDDISDLDVNLARILPENIAKRFCVVVVGEEEDKIVVAMADPLNVIDIDTISLKIKRQIKVVISSESRINRAIETIYHGSDIEEQHLRDLIEFEIETEQANKDEFEESESVSEAEATKAPVVRFVDLLLSHAVKSRASDIHIEPQEDTMVIRLRIDGVLHEVVPPPKSMQAAVVTRIKILSEMDIAERRLPQDGRFKIKTSGRTIDVRVSVIPVIYGEKAVLRILDSSAVDLDLNKLGFGGDLLDEFKVILSQPNGIIVVTGPTGSGKSTTLYSVLNFLKDPTKNITTVEDPVEYRLNGINQIQIKPEIHLDFAKSLRAILRQDPDIVLIGEIRDKETVDIAIKASLTGHLVLSTFHTNDAPSAVSRLVYMGVEPFLLASTLKLVLAQRLVRRICESCKEPVELNNEVLGRLGIDSATAKNTVFYAGKGCKTCGGTGYMGRLPIFEFLIMDSDVRDTLFRNGNEAEIRQVVREKGYTGLLESGVAKMIEGLTTAEEVLRVTCTDKSKT
ncbi:MAG: Flp pilus assembly complex ATPase component TadA [Sedimentisphaerales bacterium]|nr:Flp pilus assembly complex ATPase component TadA [Sedimentisphaerales bacterium]